MDIDLSSCCSLHKNSMAGYIGDKLLLNIDRGNKETGIVDILIVKNLSIDLMDIEPHKCTNQHLNTPFCRINII